MTGFSIEIIRSITHVPDLMAVFVDGDGDDVCREPCVLAACRVQDIADDGTTDLDIYETILPMSWSHEDKAWESVSTYRSFLGLEFDGDEDWTERIEEHNSKKTEEEK